MYQNTPEITLIRNMIYNYVGVRAECVVNKQTEKQTYKHSTSLLVQREVRHSAELAVVFEIDDD